MRARSRMTHLRVPGALKVWRARLIVGCVRSNACSSICPWSTPRRSRIRTVRSRCSARYSTMWRKHKESHLQISSTSPNVIATLSIGSAASRIATSCSAVLQRRTNRYSCNSRVRRFSETRKLFFAASPLTKEPVTHRDRSDDTGQIREQGTPDGMPYAADTDGAEVHRDHIERRLGAALHSG